MHEVVVYSFTFNLLAQHLAVFGVVGVKPLVQAVAALQSLLNAVALAMADLVQHFAPSTLGILAPSVPHSKALHASLYLVASAIGRQHAVLFKLIAVLLPVVVGQLGTQVS